MFLRREGERYTAPLPFTGSFGGSRLLSWPQDRVLRANVSIKHEDFVLQVCHRRRPYENALRQLRQLVRTQGPVDRELWRSWWWVIRCRAGGAAFYSVGGVSYPHKVGRGLPNSYAAAVPLSAWYTTLLNAMLLKLTGIPVNPAQ